MAFLKNAWYVVAWGEEIGREPLGRKVLGHELVLFRKENTDPVALGGVCPHRFAPLAMGRLVGDVIECGYHGLQFDCAGACVHNPNPGGSAPPKTNVPAFRVEERHKLIWLWGGDADAADPSKIPNLDWLDDPTRATVVGHLHVDANYQLYIDNLMDLTHAQFVHRDQLAVDRYPDAQFDVNESAGKVSATIHVPDSGVPPVFTAFVGETDARGDFVLISHWQVPSIVTNDISFRENESGSLLFQSYGTHVVTPESEHTAHYFYGLTRSHRVGDPAADDAARAWHLRGFNEQDKPIIEAAARMMGSETDPLALGAAGVPTDGANIRARRVLQKRIAHEANLER